MANDATKAILEVLEHEFPELLTADGFDDAIIGLVSGACRHPVVCYDYLKCVKILMERDGMSEEDAKEFLEFNTLGAYVGEYTPLFVDNWRAVYTAEEPKEKKRAKRSERPIHPSRRENNGL